MHTRRPFPSSTLPVLFGLALLPTQCPAQSILDRATPNAEVTDEELEQAWETRFDQRIGQPGRIEPPHLLAALRRGLRETRPENDRAEKGYWLRLGPGGTKSIFVSVSDVSAVTCDPQSDTRATCSAIVQSAMSFRPEVRRMLGGQAFDVASGMTSDGYIRWSTDLVVDLTYSDDRGWQVDPASPDLMALEQPPVSQTNPAGYEAPPPGLECLGLGGWGVAIGC